MAIFWQATEIPVFCLPEGIEAWLAGPDPNKSEYVCRVTATLEDGSPAQVDPCLILRLRSTLDALAKSGTTGNVIVTDPRTLSDMLKPRLFRWASQREPDPCGFGLERFTR